MLKAITDFLENKLGGAPEARNQQHTIEVAAAALIVEVMRMDGEVSAAEREAALRAVRDKFGLDAAEGRTLIELAETEARTANDYYQFTTLINKGFTRDQKIRVIELMWHVAYADGERNVHEDHMIRKIADLIYVDHGDYIAAKLKARDAANSGA